MLNKGLITRLGGMQMLTRDEFERQTFDSHRIVEFIDKKGLYKVPKDWEPIDNKAALREKIKNIMWNKSDTYRIENKVNSGDYSIIESLSAIPTDTMKKALNGKYKITRNFLAKFVVGLKLNIEEANELFELHSWGLSERNSFDFIVIHALKTKDNIYDFMEEVYVFLEIKLDKDIY